MSHTDSTQQKFDTNFPEWLSHKLWVKQVDPQPVGLARQTQKRQWRKDIEMELSQ